jgi:hypothetical protein
MAAKRIDPLKAKEAKQKKIAAVGGVLLLALLGFQGPKTLKMLQGPQPVATPAAAAPTPTPGVTPAATPGAPAAAPATAADLASVADSDAAPTVEQGRLATFERFTSKDPFAQQALPLPEPPPAAKPADATKPAPAGRVGVEKPAESGADEAGDTGGFTTGGAEPAAAVRAETTSISVNGVVEDIALEATFPKDEPTFVLVSIAKNGKSVQIGIAGGEYAGGGQTMKLALGKKITLQNTADGSRYELELRSIEGFPLPKPSR